MTEQLKSDGPYQDAQLSEELARYVMGSEPFKTPAEWWARGEIESLRARIVELEAALSSVLIGGNHLALLIGADHPLHTASHDEALAHYGSGDIYEIWCCWRAMMNAGPVLDASAALKGEKA